MTQIKERCSCGATFEIEDHKAGWVASAAGAAAEWRADHRHLMPHEPSPAVVAVPPCDECEERDVSTKVEGEE